MEIFTNILVLAIAVLHIYILVIEMWLWDRSIGLRAFNLTEEFAKSTKVLAANQGLYNGFLAVGLVWGVLHPNYDFGIQIQLFFLGCIFFAGLYGAYTAAKKILFVQTVPSSIAIVFILMNYFNIS